MKTARMGRRVSSLGRKTQGSRSGPGFHQGQAARAPHSPQLIQLGREYGAEPARFESDTNFCILCGLCVRYCNEVKQLDAVGFVERGVNKEICFVPEVALKACSSCKECFPLCPTSYLQAAFVLLEAQS